MAILLLDGVVATCTSTGIGTLNLGIAVPPYLTPAQAGAVSTNQYYYSIIDAIGGNSEYGSCIWTSGGVNGSISSRTVYKSTNSNAAINATTNAIIRLGAALNETFTIISIHVQQFSSSGTYTPTVGMQYCIIECVGGGGGGGGALSGVTGVSVGGGGGGGSYARAYKTIAQVGASQTVTVGGGGNGGTAGANNGSSGADTSVGTLCIGKGGSGGGAGGSNINSGSGGSGGVAGTGDFVVPGNGGQSSIGEQNLLIQVFQGPGGSGPQGGQIASPGTYFQQSANGNAAGTNTGAGGNGGVSYNATSASGGQGGSGYVVITEFCNQ